MKSAPASIFFCSGTGDHFASGRRGTSAAPMKNFGGESILRAEGSSPLSRMSRASFSRSIDSKSNTGFASG